MTADHHSTPAVRTPPGACCTLLILLLLPAFRCYSCSLSSGHRGTIPSPHEAAKRQAGRHHGRPRRRPATTALPPPPSPSSSTCAPTPTAAIPPPSSTSMSRRAAHAAPAALITTSLPPLEVYSGSVFSGHLPHGRRRADPRPHGFLAPWLQVMEKRPSAWPHEW